MDEATPNEPSCTCVIRHIPALATTSMVDCREHGDRNELAPLPGQSLSYCFLISRNEEYSGIFVNTPEGIEEARYLAIHLGYKTHGAYAMSSLGDLRAVAEKMGYVTQDQLPPSKSKPRNLIQEQIHAPGCMYAQQGHPGGCYLGTA
jgi:hypothetical protein